MVTYHEYYRLDGKTAIPCGALEWSRARGTIDDRRVALTEIADGVRVSTVFLGLNHAIPGESPAIFESMVFADDEAIDQRADRYATWEEAEAGHAAMVEEVKAYLIVHRAGLIGEDAK